MTAGPAAFWDSSALVPLCLRELTTPRAREAVRRVETVVWWATAVEIASAIARSRQSGSIDDPEAQNAYAALNRLKVQWREMAPDGEVRDLACDLLGRYPLRAADSLQLAAAMVWCRGKPAGRTFFCADRRLSEAALAAGFSVIKF